MKKKVFAAGILLAAVAVALFLLLRPGPPPASLRVLVDGQALSSPVLSPEKDGLRVILTLDGAEIADLPFDEAHTVRVLQENGDENTLVITGESVHMESSNC